MDRGKVCLFGRDRYPFAGVGAENHRGQRRKSGAMDGHESKGMNSGKEEQNRFFHRIAKSIPSLIC